MKLVIREYLASLKERDELDAVLPDLLTELGFTVYSRPARGTRQYGVDVAAVGPGQDGILRVHLFSVKSGDLDRNEWNTASPQSLRPSLDEILDHYIATRIPPEYANLPIAICLTFGGAIDEQVRDFVQAQPGGEQVIEQVDQALDSFFTDATPGLASRLVSEAVGLGLGTPAPAVDA